MINKSSCAVVCLVAMLIGSSASAQPLTGLPTDTLRQVPDFYGCARFIGKPWKDEKNNSLVKVYSTCDYEQDIFFMPTLPPIGKFWSNIQTMMFDCEKTETAWIATTYYSQQFWRAEVRSTDTKTPFSSFPLAGEMDWLNIVCRSS